MLSLVAFANRKHVIGLEYPMLLDDPPNVDSESLKDLGRLFLKERMALRFRSLALLQSLGHRGGGAHAPPLGRGNSHLQSLRPALPDDAEAEHPKVRELRKLVQWCEGYGVVQSGAAWRDGRHHESADRLEPTGA